jgi:type IV pilus assembly protein PilQ
MKADIPIKNPEKAQSVRVESVKVEPVKIVPPKINKKSVARASIQIPKKSVSKTNELTSVDFFSEEKTHRLVFQAAAPLKYRMIPKKNAKQVIYVFERTSTPKKLRREYDTKEFKSAIVKYSLNQTIKKKIPSTQLIVQMREFLLPRAIQTENKLVLEFEDKGKSKPDRLIASELPATSFGEDAFDAGRGYRGEPIEKLELKNTDVAEAIKLVVRSSGYNIVLGDDVKGNIGSLSLQNIPWDQALHIILQMKKLGFVRKGNLVRVASFECLIAELVQLEQQEDLEPL